MDIRIISDLHNEFRKSSLSIPVLEKEKSQVLILAGDIFTFKMIKSHRDLLLEYSNRFLAVIYIFGNHEFYGSKLDYSRINKFFDEFDLPENFHVLNRFKPSVKIEDKVFVGATLWTDFNREKTFEYYISQSMNDFKRITYVENGLYHKLKTRNWFKEFTEDFNHIKSEIEKNKDSEIIIITHHAPSLKSCDERYSNDVEMKFAYASDLEDFLSSLTNVKLWIHGHIHMPKDYYVGNVRVFSNPYGYLGEFGSDDSQSDKLKVTLTV